MPSRRTIIVSILAVVPLGLVLLNLQAVSQATSPAPRHITPKDTDSVQTTLDAIRGEERRSGEEIRHAAQDLTNAEAIVGRLERAGNEIADLFAEREASEASRDAAEAVAEAEKRRINHDAPWEREVKALKVCAHVDTFSRVHGHKKGDHHPLEHGNESLCIAPHIQLREKLKVRLVPKGEKGGKRAFFLVSQGLRQHPMVELVGGPYRFCKDRGYTLDNKHSKCEPDIRKLGEKSDADVAIVVMPANDPKFYSSGKAAAFLPYRWGGNKKLAADPVEDVGTVKGYEKITHADENPTLYRYAPPVSANRMIFVDEADWASSHAHVMDDAASYLAYFKRSWVDKRDAVPSKASNSRHSQSKSYFPMPYALADEYVDSDKLGDVVGARPIDVVCTLRDNRGGRGRTLKWLKEYARDKKLHDVRLGQLSSAGRTVIDTGYLSTMRRAKVVVTCNPTGWEGDFRLFEALSSGALVMVDRMGTPYHHPLLDGEHVVYYDHTNKTDLLDKLEHALKRPHWARKVGVKGYAHVLRHHRSVSWVDFFLRTAHARMLAEEGKEQHYTETGQAVLARANRAVAGAAPVKADFATRREHGALAFAANEHSDDDTLRAADV